MVSRSLLLLAHRSMRILSHHQHTPPPELRIRSQVEAPQELLLVVSRLLCKLSSERYRSITELRRDLESLPKPDYIEPLLPIDESDDSYLDFSMDGSVDFSIDELQEFNLDGYRFSKKDSKEYSPVFLRKG